MDFSKEELTRMINTVRQSQEIMDGYLDLIRNSHDQATRIDELTAEVLKLQAENQNLKAQLNV